MRRLLLAFAALAFSASAAAQLYKWKDPNGRLQYGDTPPPGVEATPMRGPAAGTPPPAPDTKKADGKTEKPLSPEAAFQKRQQEREAAEQKSEKERAQAEQKRANCEQARGQLRALESGVRMVTVTADGERVVMDDAARAQQVEQAQKSVAEWCN
ncbi:MAG TPA: DUF4124 domain-containing protein [Burkholderiales bacterium]|jgi:type IV secretory pathway VirB10-like protein|nr:DUF4124 domain-containing protein [Burkholderiales bacterium]